MQHCIELIEYMNPILEQKILTNLEQNSMIDRMDEVLEKAWSLEPEKISSVVYEKLCARLMEIPDYEKCGHSVPWSSIQECSRAIPAS